MNLIDKLELSSVKFHGCAVGLKDSKGMPLYKPWTFQTDCDHIIEKFTHLRCTRDHEHGVVRGKAAKNSEDYTIDFVAALHDAFRESLQLPKP